MEPSSVFFYRFNPERRRSTRSRSSESPLEQHMTGAIHKVRLVCWNEELAQQHSDEITKLGYRVDASSLHGSSAFVTHFRNLNPAAIVIDLDRLPSYGREIATVLRSSKTTR